MKQYGRYQRKTVIGGRLARWWYLLTSGMYRGECAQDIIIHGPAGKRTQWLGVVKSNTILRVYYSDPVG